MCAREREGARDLGAPALALAPASMTVAESGFPGFEVETYFVMLAPAGIVEPIAQLLEREVRAAIKSPDLAEKFRMQDLGVVGTTGVEAAARIKADTELWAGIVQATNMKAE